MLLRAHTNLWQLHAAAAAIGVEGGTMTAPAPSAPAANRKPDLIPHY
jgi:hypothetical protein